jgi:hypothetical protein
MASIISCTVKRREGVALLRPVDGDLGDAVVELEQDFLVLLDRAPLDLRLGAVSVDKLGHLFISSIWMISAAPTRGHNCWLLYPRWWDFSVNLRTKQHLSFTTSSHWPAKLPPATNSALVRPMQ